MTVALSWSDFGSIFSGLAEWVHTLYDLFDSVVLIEMGSAELSLLDFGLFLLFMEIVLIIYLRLR